MVPEKPPQAVYEQERQKDQVKTVETGETGQLWEADQSAPPISAAEVIHTASEQNVASAAQTPAQEQHGPGQSLFNLPEDDVEEEFEAVEQGISEDFAEDFSEDYSEDTSPQRAAKKSMLSSMFSSLLAKVGRRNNQDEYEEYEQGEDYEEQDGQYEADGSTGHNKYAGQNAYGEHNEQNAPDEYDEYDEYDDMDPVLLDDRPQRPWWHWLAGLGILATLLYAAWQFFRLPRRLRHMSRIHRRVDEVRRVRSPEMRHLITEYGIIV